MSTVTDIGPAPAVDSAGVAPRRRARRVVVALVALLVLLAVAGGASAAALWSWDAGYEGRVLPGVSVGTVEVSGMTRDEALAAISAAYPFGHGQAPPADTRRRRRDPVRRGRSRAEHGRGRRRGDGDRPRRGPGGPRTVGQVRLALEGTTLPAAAVGLDEAALTARVTDVVEALRHYPVSATIAMTKKGVVVGRARTGRDADADPVVAAAVAALRDPAAATETVIPVETTTRPSEGRGQRRVRRPDPGGAHGPRDRARDEEAHTWAIKASEVRSWIRFAPAAGGTVVPVLDESAIPANLSRPAKAVKKPAKSAEYLRARSGKIVGVVASSAGRKLDKPATVAAIIAELQRRSERRDATAGEGPHGARRAEARDERGREEGARS